ncbi:MAG: lysine--tRNA ligase [Candidatus Diapherotrites archaeon]|uniref:Lysine--tRNA ligase n=1 Tax=Candidatus Iainarchaeum sp. TaxID=3101447 RepID=A0A2D6LQ07_9ARCH|nr:lysine--tRNA ligase [Candidatus Diapherotrites archaeon]|tara:strand:+ start:22380 stop:24002 length:1623 start_codon:yes stop_codon:yes gene_type:complete
MEENIQFWAEKIAKDIQERKKFHFLDKSIPELKNPTIKSSSSLSGVLHIGRLSDIIRGEAVFRALKENNSNAEFIYVTEDMDPLRKIPKGVPKDFEQYIGMPVSNVPDPEGCHASYGDHFKEKFLKIFDGFLTYEPKLYSMSEEYKKGNFTPYILELVKNTEKAKEIISRFQDSPVSDTWTSWKPICENCGKLQTTVVTKISGTKIDYVCKDYDFETTKAIGCNHEGTSDLKKAVGKLIWKSEWAAQWKRWQVVSEGAGKEYNAPNSAWFVNAEICEKVLDYPMPEPIFYEHLFIDGQKMSASVGNVVYPHEWLEVGRPEALKLLYMKKLAKTRSFSWKDLPILESELDKAALADTLITELGDSKEKKQLQKLYHYSKVKGREAFPVQVDYSLVASLVTTIPDNQLLFEKLVEMQEFDKQGLEKMKEQVFERMNHARNWVEKYVPEKKLEFVEEYSVEGIDEKTKKLFADIANELDKDNSVGEVQQRIFETAKANGIKPQDLFRSLYQVMIGKERGPKIGTLVFAFGKEKVIERLKEISS